MQQFAQHFQTPYTEYYSSSPMPMTLENNLHQYQTDNMRICLQSYTDILIDVIELGHAYKPNEEGCVDTIQQWQDTRARSNTPHTPPLSSSQTFLPMLDSLATHDPPHITHSLPTCDQGTGNKNEKGLCIENKIYFLG